jgi:ribosomal protection tetracycline resistance protein
VRNLNLGIVAHVDAGKTTLTERLLFAAGVIDTIGSVDRGSTQTDSLALERRRGITIKSAVVSFEVDGVRVNLIDTPGHPDFIAEVERALHILDGAVLVVSAVEGVQAQTRVLMRALQRLSIPTLIFVNKIDRAGASDEDLVAGIRSRLTPAVLPMGAPGGLGTQEAAFTPFDVADKDFATALVDLLSDHDDAFLAAYVRDETAHSAGELRDRLVEQTRQALVYPLFFGSAITGAGVGPLTAAFPMLVPAVERSVDSPLSGVVFKVDRGPAGERVGYVKIDSGAVHVRDEIAIAGRKAKVTGVKVFDRGGAALASTATAGRIALLSGLGDIRIGDTIGEPLASRPSGRFFAPPTLETVVAPERQSDRGRLHVALTQLAEQDPLINLREDVTRDEVHISLYGEVQKEVIQATLADEFGVGATFRESTTICIERPAAVGEDVEVIKGDDNPFLATVGLRVEPAPIGSGIEFRLEVELGAMPFAFFKAVEETVRETLLQGLRGWEVVDCAVVMTRSGYWPRQSRMHGTFDKSMSSTAGDFRSVTPLVVMNALRRAGTKVYEPMHRFRLDIPADTVGQVVPILTKLHSTPETMAVEGASYLLEGAIPAANVHRLQQHIPGLTRGEGVLESEFDEYQLVRGRPPSRPRSGHDPLDRKRYLLSATRQRFVEAGLS